MSPAGQSPGGGRGRPPAAAPADGGLSADTVRCPYCGETVELLLDASAGAQDYVEDCPVCCRPMRVALAVDADGIGSASVRGENEA